LKAAQHHYFEWNNPGFQGIKGYEDYAQRPAADVGRADGDRAEANVAARMGTQPIGTPDEIIDRIKTLQWSISLETLVIHYFYGGMPLEKAKRSLELFAEKVLPAVHAMDTPINPASLGG
jgi:alkanesulfonate monooxygenase SsuD/methylene tetrahydromethanopterin reductase-like flavin-dependent oxidoreductase (luciferase family)